MGPQPLFLSGKIVQPNSVFSAPGRWVVMKSLKVVEKCSSRSVASSTVSAFLFIIFDTTPSFSKGEMEQVE